MLSPVIIERVIPESVARELVQLVREMPHIDGRSTAGRWAVDVKQNAHADPEYASALSQQISDLVAGEKRVALLAMPNRVTRPLFVRYCEGDYYGRHEDNAWQVDTRADISFTLFLSSPRDYVGGELLLGSDRTPVSGQPGSLLLYPSGMRHEVRPVVCGVRHVAVGWIQSWIRDPVQRQLLAAFAEALESARVDFNDAIPVWLEELNMIRNNLVRRWGEV